MAEDLPEGISVDSVVGLAKVDETSVDWSLVFEGIYIIISLVKIQNPEMSLLPLRVCKIQ